MSEEFFYPNLDEKSISLVARLYENNPGYFESPSCPYPKKVIEIFTKTAMYNDFDTHVPPAKNILSQINALSQELKVYGLNIKDGSSASAGDRNTYFRLSVTLLEKLIDIKERTVKIEDYERFISVVLDIMDKELNPDQRQKVLERMKPLVEDIQTAESGAPNEEEPTTPKQV